MGGIEEKKRKKDSSARRKDGWKKAEIHISRQLKNRGKGGNKSKTLV